ncbi:MAG: DeoR/GlpR family DNA-binding transcription regulator [Hyphomicrobiales bacterium]
MILNVPDTRQRVLEQRLVDGEQIVAAEAAVEFSVSIDTIRRDILALEASGLALRVRGGAVPVAQPASPLHARLSSQEVVNPLLVSATLDLIGDAATLILDGGSTTLALAHKLPAIAGRLVITPSPWIAIACQENSIDVFMLGGKLSESGGVNVGGFTLNSISDVAADIAVLGACGLDDEFGLSSDDFDESALKKAMSAVAPRTFIMTGDTKIGRRARHHTLQLAKINHVITDAAPEKTTPLSNAGLCVTNV